MEHDVKELLSTMAEEIEPSPAMPPRTLRRARRGVAATLVVGLTGVGLAALGIAIGLRGLSIPTGKTPATEPPAPVEKAMPSSFVGLKGGELVLASTETGEVLRVIADRSVVGTDDPGADPAPPVRPALAPDGSAVYLSTFRPGVEGRRLVRLPLEGGEPEDLGWGADPAVSPDGDRLAYRACTERGCGQALVVLDLRTGEETRVGPGDVDLQVGKTVWLPDGRLVVELLPPMDYSYGSPYRVIDPARAPGDLLDAPSVPNPPNTGRFGLYGYHAPTDGVIVGQFVQGEGPAPAPDEPVRYVSVDPDTGMVLATVVRGGWRQMHSDASGRDLLLVDFRDRVYVSRDGGKPELIAEGFSDVAW